MPKKKVYVAKSTGRTWNTIEEAIKDNANYKNDIHYRYSIKSGKYKSPLKDYNIPFIPEKKITLTNAGLATGAVLSTNLLDSIAVNAERAGLPIKTAIGLATKESTLNNPTYDIRSRAKIAKFERSELKKAKRLGFEENIKPKQNIDNGDTPEGLLISYNPDDNPYQGAVNYIFNKAKTWEDNIRMMKENEAYADRVAARNESSPSKSYLQAGFEAYKKNPQGYNPGQSNYVQLVQKRADEVWGSPEIQNWYKKYNKRSLEDGRTQKKEGGIHIAPSKRGTFTAAASKHGMGVQEFASRVLRNKDSYSPAMVKKANFARNTSKWNH